MRSTSAATETSVLTGLAVPPRASISATSESSSPRRRAATTTFAPLAANSAAVARPIPLLAPVIRATLSFLSDAAVVMCGLEPVCCRFSSGMDTWLDSLGMQVEHLAQDLPLPVDPDQREEVGEAMAGPVVELDADRGCAALDVDPALADLQALGRPVFGVPVVEHLDRPGEQVGADVAADRGQLVEDRAQEVTVSGSSAPDVGVHHGFDLSSIVGRG